MSTIKSIKYIPKQPITIDLQQFNIEGYDFGCQEDRETVARLLEAIGIFGVFTSYKLMELINKKIDTEGENTKLLDLAKASQAISYSTSLTIEKAGLVRQGVEGGRATEPEEFRKPEYVKALEDAADVLKQAS